MPTDVPRPSLRLAAVLAVLVLAGSPALAQTKFPHFETKPPITVGIGTEPSKNAFTLADVNGDRLLDIIAIEPAFNRVDVFVNLGNGTFDLLETPTTIDDVTPTAVAVADVASPFLSASAGKPDGKPDIIVGGDSGEMQVIFGRGDGHFDPPEPPADSVTPSEDVADNIVGIVTGDFDEGNGTDVALLDEGGVVLMCNDGNGNLSVCSGGDPLPAGDDPTRILAGDFDGDANFDVAVLNQSDQMVDVLHGNGDGTFDAPVTVTVAGEVSGSDTTDIALGRIDGDNVDDFAAVNSDELLQFLGVTALGLSNGRFQTINFVTNFDASAIAVADFDGDRNADTVVGLGGPEEHGVRFNFGDGTGNLADPIAVTGANLGDVQNLETGDLGGDTLPDFVSLNVNGDQLRVSINKSNEATPTPGPTTPTTPSPTVTGPAPPTSTITATNTPSPTFTATSTPTPVPTANFGRCDAQVGTNLAAVAAGDLDGDGLPDLAASDSGAGVVRIVFSSAVLGQVKACAMAMSGRAIPSTTVDLGLSSPVPTDMPIAIADLDRDGANEIAVGAGNRVIILKRNTSGTFAPAGDIPVDGTVSAITATYPNRPSEPGSRAQLDLNGDGVTDLVIADGTTTLTIVYGVARQLPGRITRTDLVSCVAAFTDAADFNGDDRIDIAVSCGNNARWLQQQPGDQPFQVKMPFGDGEIVGLVAGYLNGDGLPDLLITRGGSSPAGEAFMFSSSSFPQIANSTFAVGDNPIAGGLGRLNPARNRFDAVVAGQDGSDSVLQFAYNDGAGGFSGPVVMPFLVHNTPRGLTVVDFDNDGQQDVALANNDGTLTILVSSVPPPTPTPTQTPLATATGTATPSETPSLTPTPSDTPSETPTITPTPTPTVTRTGTPGNTPTPTNTRGGIVLGSCAIGDQGGSSPLQMTLIAVLLAGVRLLAARRTRAVSAEHVRHR